MMVKTGVMLHAVRTKKPINASLSFFFHFDHLVVQEAVKGYSPKVPDMCFGKAGGGKW